MSRKSIEFEKHSNVNRRVSFRCPSAEGSRAVLRIGRKNFVVRLIDQSATGFSIKTQLRLRLRQGQVVRLRTHAGWTEVEVTRISKSSGESLIGLRRLKDIADVRSADINRILGTQRATDHSMRPFADGLMGFIFRTMLVGVVAGGLIIAKPIWLPKVRDWWQIQSVRWQSLPSMRESAEQSNPAPNQPV